MKNTYITKRQSCLKFWTVQLPSNSESLGRLLKKITVLLPPTVSCKFKWISSCLCSLNLFLFGILLLIKVGKKQSDGCSNHNTIPSFLLEIKMHVGGGDSLAFPLIFFVATGRWLKILPLCKCKYDIMSVCLSVLKNLKLQKCSQTQTDFILFYFCSWLAEW